MAEEPQITTNAVLLFELSERQALIGVLVVDERDANVVVDDHSVVFIEGGMFLWREEPWHATAGSIGGQRGSYGSARRNKKSCAPRR
jgi:hypothetical protein